MADLLRQVTIERGHDPREFVMFAGGGSGPSHAWVLARELGVESFIVPAVATAQSAYGTGTSDIRITGEKPVYLRIAPDTTPNKAQLGAVQTTFDEAGREVNSLLPKEMIEDGAWLERTVALRYRGQAHHLDVPFNGSSVDEEGFAECLDRFECEYELLFGKGAAFREAGFEVTSVRIIATGVDTGNHDTPSAPASGGALELIGSRRVFFDDSRQPVETDVYAVEYPEAAQKAGGPCIIEFPGQTVVVPPGSTAVSDEFGNLLVRRGK